MLTVARLRSREAQACILATAFACLAAAGSVRAADQFQFYFGASTAGAGLLGGAAIDASGDYWLIGFGGEQRIRHVEFNGSSWSGTDAVVTGELAAFYRSDDLASGIANSNWGGQLGGSAAGLSLNPAPLTIDVPTGDGGVETITYPAGSLAYIIDAVGVPVDTSSNQRPDVAKKLFRYDLRETFQPTAVSPDFATATGFVGGPVFGSKGIADWNDVFAPVVSEQDLRNQSGSGGSDNFGRQFAWSTDGQWIYAVDSSVGQGGIYKIDPTRSANAEGGITRILDDGGSNTSVEPSLASIRSEPAIVHTSTFDYSVGNLAEGDQIIVEGSFESGNSGGVHVYVDDGSSSLAAPTVLFTEDDFRDFADYQAVSKPRYVSIADDADGNLYMYEQQTDMLFRYDTQGRFSKVASEREHTLFQLANREGVIIINDDISNMTLRTSLSAGFEVTEVVYVDSTINAPVGILVFEPGDFDRDNDVDAADLTAFASRLGTRNAPADDADVRFDLNGNEVAFNDVNDDGEPIVRHVNNGSIVIDWKDVKILQQFVDIPNGDTNFDGVLDFADVDVLGANYFTVSGEANKTWATGDFGSIDPAYKFDAPDANLVNEVDIALLADAWINELGLAPITAADADARGYSGQFREDLLAAFSLTDVLAGDYNLDGAVDAADYTVWRDSLGSVGVSLVADGDGDGIVDGDDYLVWRNNFGRFAPAPDGDYNRDGVVNAADYTVWRDNLGQEGVGLIADGNGDGRTDGDDYLIWRSGYGTVTSTVSSNALPTPEPSSAAILIAGVAIYATRRRFLASQE